MLWATPEDSGGGLEEFDQLAGLARPQTGHQPQSKPVQFILAG